MPLAELAERAGVPAGVINLVTGKTAKIGTRTDFKSNLVRKLTFTGSTPVGKQLMAECAGDGQTHVNGAGWQCAVYRL